MRTSLLTICFTFVIVIFALCACSNSTKSIKLSDVQVMQIFEPSKLSTFYGIKKVNSEKTILTWVNEAQNTTYNVPKGATSDLDSSSRFEEPYGTTTLMITTNEQTVSYRPTFYLSLYRNGQYKMHLVRDIITVVDQTKGSSSYSTYHLRSKTLFNWLMNKQEWITATK